jgi:hypothetical protein
MGIVMVVLAAAGAKGAKEARTEAGVVMEAGEVVSDLGVAGVEETEGANDTGEAELLCGNCGRG